MKRHKHKDHPPCWLWLHSTTEDAEAASAERVKTIKENSVKEICDIPIDTEAARESIKKFHIDREGFERKHPVKPTGHTLLSANVFPAMLAVMQQIVQGTRWDKKARIVLEYDPQSGKMEIDVFMESPDATGMGEQPVEWTDQFILFPNDDEHTVIVDLIPSGATLKLDKRHAQLLADQLIHQIQTW